MRLIVTDLYDRLRAALPEAVPVLTPEQRELPLAGRKPGQPGGVGGYLAAHPAGYVQLEEPQGIRTAGAQDVFWVAVACIAPTPEGAEALAREVLRVTCGIATREPGQYTLVTPDSPRALTPGAYLTRPTLQAVLTGGSL